MTAPLSPKLLRRALQVCAVLIAGWALATSLNQGAGRDPFHARGVQDSRPPEMTDGARQTLRYVESTPGSDLPHLRLPPAARDGLVKLVNMWERYDDLRRYTITASGEGENLPSVPGLLDWAMTTTDSRAIELLPWQGALQELSDAMGRVRPNGDVLQPLIVRSNARTHRSIDADDALFTVAAKMHDRPDLHDRFVIDGVVQIRMIAEWASTVGADDPDREWLLPRVPDFARLLGDISS